MENNPNYWGFRIDWRNKKAFVFLKKEIENGRLRQGWGWDEKQKLPHPTLKQGEQDNLPIYNKVKKGDYLLVPHVPSYELVTIVRATNDFNGEGYEFQIDPTLGDYGHIFHIEQVKKFARGNEYVHADVRSSLRNPSRFWSMSHHAEQIQKIIDSDEKDLLSLSQYDTLVLAKLDEAIQHTIDEDTLKNELKTLFEQSFQSAEWEFAIQKALEIVLPNSCVEHVGGRSEKKHGCDIVVSLPSIEKERRYVIGIQIKDYKGVVNSKVLKQIMKADEYWSDNNNILIAKYLIIIDSSKEKNSELEEKAKQANVHVLYREDILDLLARAAKVQMANNVKY